MSIHCKAYQSGAVPAGSDEQIQYNDGGQFGADAGLFWDVSEETLQSTNVSTLGMNFIVNGTFVTDTDWTKTGDAYIDTVNQWADFNVAAYIGQTGTWSPSTPLTITAGRQYLITFDLTASNYDFSFTCGGFSSSTYSSSGSYALVFTASSTANLVFTGTCMGLKKANFNFDNVEIRELGNLTGYVDSYGQNWRGDVSLESDNAISIGDITNGIKEIHLAAPSALGYALPGFTGLVCRQYAGGDMYIGNDNVFPGYYVQKTVIHNSVVSDNSEDYTNLYQGDAGYHLIAMMYAIEYASDNGVILGDGTTDPPSFWFGSTSTLGFKLNLDRPNQIFEMASPGIPIIEIALNHATTQECVRPDTDNKIDLGDTANSLIWRNIYAYVINAATRFDVGANQGHTGWIDDGANFRATITGGIITAVGNSVAGGWA